MDGYLVLLSAQVPESFGAYSRLWYNDDAKLLADENIHPDVITFLRQRGQNVVDVFQYDLSGSPE